MQSLENLDSPAGDIFRGAGSVLRETAAASLGTEHEILVPAQLVEGFQQRPRCASASSDGFWCSALIHKSASLFPQGASRNLGLRHGC